MRHVLVVAVLVATTGSAFALDHNAKITEILLSKGGDDTVQFIEILDPLNEPFPSPPYQLAFFDAAGAPTGTLTLALSGAHTKWLVGTANADTQYGTTRNDTLNATLPPNGQVCLQRSAGASNISCVAWGCITTFVTGVVRAPSPPDSMSAQRQGITTQFQIANPTPNADNIAGATVTNCPTDPQDSPPDASIPHDAPKNGDAGMNPNTGGGCCSVNRDGDALGGTLLAGLTLVLLRRKRY